MKKSTLAFLAFVAISLLPALSSAQVQKGTWRLHLESAILGFFTGEVDWDDAGDDDFDGVSVGVGIPGSSGGHLGQAFLRPDLALGAGLVVIDGLTVGLRAIFGFAHIDDDDGADYTSFSWGAVPYAEYAFLSGMFRPFVTAQLGFMGVAGEIDAGNHDDDFHAWLFVIGGGGGAHLFAADNLSFDFTLLMSGNLGGGEYDWGPGDHDFGISLFELSLLLGISGWI